MRLLENSAGLAAEIGAFTGEPGLEHRQGLLDLELAHRIPGPIPHRAVVIVGKLDQDILQRRVVLGQSRNAPMAEDRKDSGWPYLL